MIGYVLPLARSLNGEVKTTVTDHSVVLGLLLIPASGYPNNQVVVVDNLATLE